MTRRISKGLGRSTVPMVKPVPQKVKRLDASNNGVVKKEKRTKYRRKITERGAGKKRRPSRSNRALVETINSISNGKVVVPDEKVMLNSKL